MFNFQKIISNLLEVPGVCYIPGNCLHARHQGHDCRVCVENCPDKAIIMDGQLRFDEERCLGCGVCTSVCVTGAFIPRSPTRREILEGLGGRKVVTMTCRRGDKTPGMVEVPCLGYLDSQLLLAVALQGTKVYLDLSWERCITCGGKGADLVSSAVDKTNNILGALDTAENAVTVGRSIEAEVEILSRDEFLDLCRKKVGTGLKKGFTSFWDREDEPEKSGLGANRGVPREIALPEQRRLLLEAFHKRVWQRGERFMEVDELPFGALAIEDSCTGCGDCTVFCPTGALKKWVQGGNTVITHQPAHCLKCGLCALGCQAKAIRYLKTLNLDQVLSAEEIRIYELAVKRCFDCDAEINEQSDNGLCHSCQTKRELESELGKVLG
ncbi:MAG: 4Fe-4S binding protein [Clostridia bacterium]|nr:4Fe-4S binding protein [Clostridia bacterium]